MGLFDKPRRRDVTTLVLESTDLRFVTTKSSQIASWGSEALPAGLMSEGVVTDPGEMGLFIEDVFSRHGLDKKRVVTAVSGLRSIPRLLTLPKLQASVIEETISREAKKEMPISLDSLYLSWQSIPGDTEEVQRIYMLGVPRDLIDSQVRALQAAGISPFVTDIKPLALVRAIGQPDAIIVNLEEDELDLTLVTQRLPAIMRTFSLDNQDLAIEDKLDRLVTELTQTVRFFNDSHPTSPISGATPIYATGMAFGDQGAADFVRDRIEWPLLQPVPPMTCPEDMPILEYMTNLGLAVKKVP